MADLVAKKGDNDGGASFARAGSAAKEGKSTETATAAATAATATAASLEQLVASMAATSVSVPQKKTSSSGIAASAPPPLPAPRYVSVDVECVASGRGHNDRTPCWVVVVNEKCEVLLDCKIKIEAEKVFSPLTHITGVTVDMLLSEGEERDIVMQRVRALLGPEVTLVGQSVQGDVDWLGLQQGVHYADILCLADAFKVWNPKFKNYLRHSLANEAFALLGRTIQTASHSPVEDAIVSMELFVKWVKPSPKKTADGTKKLFSMFKQKQLPRSSKAAPVFVKAELAAAVCSFKFNPSKCFCGQPCASSDA
jgi:hypothetical protein